MVKLTSPYHLASPWLARRSGRRLNLDLTDRQESLNKSQFRLLRLLKDKQLKAQIHFVTKMHGQVIADELPDQEEPEHEHAANAVHV